MKKSELIPYKHVLVSRQGDVYWYVGNKFCPQEKRFDGKNKNNKPISFLCLSPNIGFSDSNEFLLDNLLANRDGYWSGVAWGEPRKYDIIFVAEILNNYEWLKYIRSHDYLPKDLSALNRWSSTKMLKLVYERTDSEMEE